MKHIYPIRYHRAPPRSRVLLLLSLILTACGGGSSSDDDAPPPEPPPASTPAAIELLDALPEDGVTLFDPGLPDVTLSHFGYADFAIGITGDCAEGVTLERELVDVGSDFDTLFEHNQVCESLQPTGAYGIGVEASRDDGTEFALTLDFSTTTEMAPDLVVQDALATSRESVAGLFRTIVDESLLGELDLPADVSVLIEDVVADLAEEAYADLLNADPLFGVTAERVSYASRQPDGSASSELTGLVAYPDTSSGEFAPRDSIIVLSHSTGVTPSDLDPTDGWFAVANLLAARGYLVIAPDNWGRGGTATRPETFLMATRTAANSLDLIRAVLADPAYDGVRGTPSPRITLVGYSQGGHTVLALWQAMAAQAPGLEVPLVYAGAGPYDLYGTARGVVEHVAGACDGGVYCRYVTDDTTVPFLTERVLPGYLEYAAEDLTLEDLVADTGLTAEFVDGFLGTDTRFDDLKGLLQQGSFTNITDGLDALSETGTRFTLFHSEFDRLVPVANTEQLVTVLESHFAVDRRTEVCNSVAYQTVFGATDRVGVSHGLCGLEMLNEVYAELR